ncbi:unnamed protein product [Chondrus crispus]|uniref:Uncharacterized protein n=1 Tax=Chondrus crispus TaxID=2769 RepID=R7QAR2_CHOCR|nr:unnamed protein product [Chondrus crispus]CDF35602.1 unnamed protein product [Chondrus crispus]|eukprot:XP_005715421.1 unnamed protein product [Chondrus crispus]
MATDTVSCGTGSSRPHSWMNRAVLATTLDSTRSGTSSTRDGVSFTSSDVKSQGLCSGVWT